MLNPFTRFLHWDQILHLYFHVVLILWVLLSFPKPLWPPPCNGIHFPQRTSKGDFNSYSRNVGSNLYLAYGFVVWIGSLFIIINKEIEEDPSFICYIIFGTHPGCSPLYFRFSLGLPQMSGSQKDYMYGTVPCHTFSERRDQKILFLISCSKVSFWMRCKEILFRIKLQQNLVPVKMQQISS